MTRYPSRSARNVTRLLAVLVPILFPHAALGMAIYTGRLDLGELAAINRMPLHLD